jgi:WD40 repeat protein
LLVHGAGGSIRLWQLPWTIGEWEDGVTRELAHLAGSRPGERGVLVSANQRLLLWWDGGTELGRWDLGHGKPLPPLAGHEQPVALAALSPDGETFASAADKTVIVWQMPTGKVRYRFQCTAAVRALRFVADRRLLVAGNADGTLTFLALDTGQLLAANKGHDAPIRSVVFSASLRNLVTLGDDGTVRLWDVQHGTPGRQLGTRHGKGRLLEITLSADATTVFVVSAGMVETWDLGTLRLRQQVTLDNWVPISDVREEPKVLVAPDGRTLALFTEGQVRLWELPGGQQRPWPSVEGNHLVGTAGAFSPDGRLLAVADGDTVCLIDVWTGEHRLWFTIPQHGHQATVTALLFAGDGSALASGAADGSVRFWDSDGRALVALRDDAVPIEGLAGFRDGLSVVSRSLPDHAEPPMLSGRPPLAALWTSGGDPVVRAWYRSSGGVRRAASETKQDSWWSCGALSPDGKMSVAAVGGLTLRDLFDHDRGQLFLRDLTTGKASHVLLHKTAGANDQVRALAFSPDSTLLASSGRFEINLWETASGDKKLKISHPFFLPADFFSCLAVTRLVFSANGKALAYIVKAVSEEPLWSLESASVLVTDLTTGALRHWLAVPSGGAVQAVAGGADGRHLAAATGREIRVWQLRPPDRFGLKRWVARSMHLFVAPKTRVTCLAFAVAPAPGRAGDEKELPFPGWLASGSEDGVIHLWDGRDQPAAELSGHTGAVRSCVFTPDGRYLISGGEDRVIRIWNLQTMKAEGSFPGHTAVIRCVAVSPDGQRLASVGADGVRLWDLLKRNSLRTLHFGLLKQPIGSLAFARNGELLVANGDRTALVWDLTQAGDGQIPTVLARPRREGVGDSDDRDEFATPESTGGATTVTASAKGNLVAVNEYDSIVVWDFSGGKPKQVRWLRPNYGERSYLRRLDAGVLSLAFLPGGKIVISGAEDGSVRCWDLADEQTWDTLRLQGNGDWVRDLAFSADGRLLAVWGDSPIITLWDLAGPAPSQPRPPSRRPGIRLQFDRGEEPFRDIAPGQQLAELQGHTAPVTVASFAPQGELLATASRDCTIRLWDVRTGKLLAVLAGHAGPVTCLAFTSDGQRLASGSTDATILLWDVSHLTSDRQPER